LRVGARVLIVLLILTSNSFAEALELKGHGGNVQGYWIAAEGDIVEDSAEDLEKYLKENKNYTRPSALPIRHHSKPARKLLDARPRSSL
jgi:hypothetical protein